MYSDEVAEILKNKIIPLTEVESSKLYQAHVSDDAYENLTVYDKFILIEADDSEYLTNPNGYINFEILPIKITVATAINNREKSIYRKDLRELKTELLNNLPKLELSFTLNIKKGGRSEFVINNRKYSAEIIEAETKIVWR